MHIQVHFFIFSYHYEFGGMYVCLLETESHSVIIPAQLEFTSPSASNSKEPESHT